jgi:hypothetical protein
MDTLWDGNQYGLNTYTRDGVDQVVFKFLKKLGGEVGARKRSKAYSNETFV